MPWIGGCAALRVDRTSRTSRASLSYGTALQRQSLSRHRPFDASAVHARAQRMGDGLSRQILKADRFILMISEDAAQMAGRVSAVGMSRRRAVALEQDANDRALCGLHLEDPPLEHDRPLRSR